MSRQTTATENSAEQLAAIVENTQDAVIGKTLDGTITSWNAAAERMYGYTEAEAVGQPITLIVPPERHHEVNDILERLARGKGVPLFETVRQRKDGRRVDVALSVSPIRNQAGEVVGCAAIARDVTARKHAERRLAVGYAVTQVLAEASSVERAVPLLLRALGRQLEWQVTELWLADPGEKMLRRRGAWTDRSLFDEAHPFTEQRTFACDEGLPGRAWASSRPVWVCDVQQDSGFQRAEAAARLGLRCGMAFPVCDQHHVLGVLTAFSTEHHEPDPPLLDQMAALGHQIGGFITRMRMQEAIARSERQLYRRTMVLEAEHEATLEALLVVCGDEQDLVLHWNRRFLELWGFTEQDMADRSDQALLEKAARRVAEPDRFLAEVNYYYEHPELVGRDELHLADGRVFDRYTAPVRDREGTIHGRGWYFRDITSLKRAEAEAAHEKAQAQRRADQLQRLSTELTQIEQRERRRLAQLLHDHLQQLLVAIKLQVVGLLRDAQASVVHETLDQIKRLADESLHASRSLTAELSPPMLYEDGFAAALEGLRRRMHQHYGLTVHLESPEQVRVPHEPTRVLLFESVRELLFNIVKHAQVDQAWVRVERVDGRVRVTVEDHGVGFDAQAIGGAASDSFGLLSVRERLEWLGGSMTIASAPGKGTCVTLTAPGGEGEEPQTPAAPAARPGPPEAHAPAATPFPPIGLVRVMLVDDHRVVREGLFRMLSEVPGLEVVAQASSGTEAVLLARQVRPDVIVMDVTLPGISGLQATRRIVAENPAVRIVGLSTHTGEDMGPQMRDAGAQAYLTKDDAPEALIDVIRGQRQG